MARDKAVLEAAREAVSAAPRRRVIAVNCDTGDDQSVRDMVLAVTMAATPQRGAVLTQARELVRRARQHGYRRDGSYSASVSGLLWGAGVADVIRLAGALADRPAARARLSLRHVRRHGPERMSRHVQETVAACGNPAVTCEAPGGPGRAIPVMPG